jgi:Holliday junction resolvase RusA-like endonuclease
MTDIIIIIPGPCPGKPRQTRSDKWKRRPCVMRHRAWSDLARECAGNRIPPAETTRHIHLNFLYEMPASWSAKKRNEMLGKIKRTSPDGDNCEKEVCDALWPRDKHPDPKRRKKDDRALGHVTHMRFWSDSSSTIIRIELI